MSEMKKAAAVGALAAGAQAADWACCVPETIPGAKVDAALDAALGKLAGDARKGLEGTIAARRQFGV